MRIKITGGTLEAEIQGNPLKTIQEQLANISQSTDSKIGQLRSAITEVAKLKNKGITEIYDEFKTHDRLIDMEIEDLKLMIENVLKSKASYSNDEKINSVMDKLRSMSSDTKGMIEAINTKIDRLAKDKTDSYSKLQAELVRIKAEDDRRIAILYKQFSTIPDIKQRIETTNIKVVKQSGEALIDSSRAKVSPHSSKSNMQDKLNAKPRMPI